MVRELFDRWALAGTADDRDRPWLMNRWEDVQGVDWPPQKIRLMARHIRNGLQVRGAGSLLEVGCGTGWLLQALRPHVAAAVGADVSENMLRHALKADSSTMFVCGDSSRLPFRTGTFDRILCYFVFINNTDMDAVKASILEILRVLKKGGAALIGQLPDRHRSGEYERAKEDYEAYCRRTFPLGRDYRTSASFPISLFDRRGLRNFLRGHNVAARFRRSFNPFYYPGQPATASWRFDMILTKR